MLKTRFIYLKSFLVISSFSYSIIGVSDLGFFCTALPNWYWICFGFIGGLMLTFTYLSVEDQKTRFKIFIYDMFYIFTLLCLGIFVPKILGLYKILLMIIVSAIMFVKSTRYKLASEQIKKL